MDHSQLLSDKFSVISLPEIYAPRQSLVERYQMSAKKRIIYISAPSGYGKTLSTRLWLENTSYKYIWISLDEYDNTVSIFYRLLCTGIFSLQPNNKAMQEILSSPSFHSSPIEHTIELISAFGIDLERYAIVLDNMHLVHNKEIIKSMLMIQKRFPGSFILLILTCDEIRYDDIKAIGQERCAIITEDHLAFSTKEIQKYFGEYNRVISFEKAEEIRSITRGWAIGVNALAMSGIIDMKVEDGQVFSNYIKSQLWDKWKTDTQEFLLRTSIVSEITTDLAIRLTNREDSLDILEELSVQNVFVSQVGKDNYRYHNLFSEFLKDILFDEHPILTKELYKIVAEYYLENNKIFQARQCALKSGNKEIIERSNHAINSTDNQNSVLSVDEFVNVYSSYSDMSNPEEVCELYPYLYSQYVGYYYVTGNAEMTLFCLDKIYEHLPVIAKEYPQFVSDVSIITLLDFRVSLFKSARKLFKYRSPSELSERLGWSSFTMQLPFFIHSGMDYSNLISGNITKQIIRFLGPMLGDIGKVLLPILNSSYMYERNELDKAQTVISNIEIGQDAIFGDEIGFCYLMQVAAIHYAIGNKKALSEAITNIEQFVSESDHSYFAPNFEAFKTKVKLMNADQKSAQQWLDNYYIVDTGKFALYKIYQHFTTTRAYIVLGYADKAREYIKGLKKLSQEFGRVIDLAEANALEAILEWAIGEKKKAVIILEEALALIQSYKYIRVIADEGNAILPILEKLNSLMKNPKYEKVINDKYLDKLIEATRIQAKTSKGIAVYLHSPKVKLSNQQKNVLSLLAEGYRNNEIAEMTNLTIHTVKYHLSAAYKKLGVDNANDAVKKVVDEKLLD